MGGMQAPRVRWVVQTLGPGLAIAATGVGAGDLLAAMLAGAGFGTTLMWVIVAGAVLKLGLNEGVARWQLATGTTLLEGWCRHLGWPVRIYFLGYLVTWSFIVAGGLMSACGVAAHALWPVISIRNWGILHSLAALALVAAGRYQLFERVMKVLIGLMTLTLLVSVVMVGPDLATLWRGLVPTLPPGSASATERPAREARSASQPGGNEVRALHPGFLHSTSLSSWIGARLLLRRGRCSRAGLGWRRVDRNRADRPGGGVCPDRTLRGGHVAARSSGSGRWRRDAGRQRSAGGLRRRDS